MGESKGCWNELGLFKEERSSRCNKAGGGRHQQSGEKDPLPLGQRQARSSRWMEKRWPLRSLSRPCHSHAAEPACVHVLSSAAEVGAGRRSLSPSGSCLVLAVSVPNRRLWLNVGHTGGSASGLGARRQWANAQQTWDGSLVVSPQNRLRALLLSFIHSFTLEESLCRHLLQTQLHHQAIVTM